jgi:hypothetical protein
MLVRLGEGFDTTFATQIDAIPGKSKKQSDQTVAVADLTDEQREHFQEVERLTAGARRTAKLAFPGETTRLREEFKVGIDTPKDLASELSRATAIQLACVKYATQLAAKGFIAADTTALDTAIKALDGVDVEQEATLDDRLDLTGEKTDAANALYHACLVIQNAARLQYPAKKDGTNATARARFLLDEFPPRDRIEPDGGTQGGATPAA